MNCYWQVNDPMEIWSLWQNKMRSLPSCSHVSTIIWLHHFNFNETSRWKAWWKLQKNAICCFELILKHIQYVLYVLLEWFVRWEVIGCTAAVLLGAASRICSKQHVAFLCSQLLYVSHNPLKWTLLLQQYPACPIWMVCEIGGKWSYSCCFIGYYFKTAHSVVTI